VARGKRKDRILSAICSVITLFDGRMLPYGLEAASHYAVLAVKARAAGKGFPTPGGTIAAIAAAHGFAVATRDASAFSTAGLKKVNP